MHRIMLYGSIVRYHCNTQHRLKCSGYFDQRDGFRACRSHLTTNFFFRPRMDALEQVFLLQKRKYTQVSSKQENLLKGDHLYSPIDHSSHYCVIKSLSLMMNTLAARITLGLWEKFSASCSPVGRTAQRTPWNETR